MCIEINIHYINKHTHYIKSVSINDKIVCEFNKDEDRIDLSPLLDCIGNSVKVVRTREYGDTTVEFFKLSNAKRNETGVIIELEELD